MSGPFAPRGGPEGPLGALAREAEAEAGREVCGFVGGRAVEARRHRWDGRDFRSIPIDS